jgi:hypothetical protein
MDIYIVRVYRRDAYDPTKISGLVETAGRDEEKVFNCLEELCETLVSPKMANRTGTSKGSGVRNLKE